MWGRALARSHTTAVLCGEIGESMTTATAKISEMSGPIDKKAALGINTKTSTPRTFSECPTLYPMTFIDLQKRLHVFWQDITGWRTVNGMTSVGLVQIDQDKGCGKSLWAVRCACGKYELRRYSDFKRKCTGNYPDYCDRCFTKWVNAKHAAAAETHNA